MKEVGTIEIKVKTRDNEKEVAVAMAGLGDLLRQFKEQNTVRDIDEHLARINGYTYALVNMDVITEDTANSKVAFAAIAAAAARRGELCRK